MLLEARAVGASAATQQEDDDDARCAEDPAATPARATLCRVVGDLSLLVGLLFRCAHSSVSTWSSPRRRPARVCPDHEPTTASTASALPAARVVEHRPCPRAC